MNHTNSFTGQVNYNNFFSPSRYVDPLYFVKSLGLQTDEQQDAQEFSKLFISLLRDQNSYLADIIDAEFGGKYKYETVCTICGNVTERRWVSLSLLD